MDFNALTKTCGVVLCPACGTKESDCLGVVDCDVWTIKCDKDVKIHKMCCKKCSVTYHVKATLTIIRSFEVVETMTKSISFGIEAERTETRTLDTVVDNVNSLNTALPVPAAA